MVVTSEREGHETDLSVIRVFGSILFCPPPLMGFISFTPPGARAIFYIVTCYIICNGARGGGGGGGKENRSEFSSL